MDQESFRNPSEQDNGARFVPFIFVLLLTADHGDTSHLDRVVLNRHLTHIQLSFIAQDSCGES